MLHSNRYHMNTPMDDMILEEREVTVDWGIPKTRHRGWEDCIGTWSKGRKVFAFPRSFTGSKELWGNTHALYILFNTFQGRNVCLLYKETNHVSGLLSDYVKWLSQNHTHRKWQSQELNMSLLIQAQCFSTNLQLPLYIHLEIWNLYDLS